MLVSDNLASCLISVINLFLSLVRKSLKNSGDNCNFISKSFFVFSKSLSPEFSSQSFLSESESGSEVEYTAWINSSLDAKDQPSFPFLPNVLQYSLSFEP